MNSWEKKKHTLLKEGVCAFRNHPANLTTDISNNYIITVDTTKYISF
jgi:hypothetical protein